MDDSKHASWPARCWQKIATSWYTAPIIFAVLAVFAIIELLGGNKTPMWGVAIVGMFYILGRRQQKKNTSQQA